MLLLLFTCIATPFRLAFFLDKPDPLIWQIINYFVDISFALDIVVIFFSAIHVTDAKLIEDRKVLAANYLTSWFLIDFISVFPFELLAENKSDYAGLVRIFRIAKLYKIIKVFRMVKLIKVMKEKN